jgi:hypothetical protein
MDQRPEELQFLNPASMRDFNIAVMDWIKKNASDFSVQGNKSYDHNEVLS